MCTMWARTKVLPGIIKHLILFYDHLGAAVTSASSGVGHIFILLKTHHRLPKASPRTINLRFMGHTDTFRDRIKMGLFLEVSSHSQRP